MVGPDGDVVRPGRDEGAEHRADALPRAGVVGEGRVPGVEDGLVAQRIAFVDVDEGLMGAVVGEERGLDVDPSGCRRALGAQREAQALPIGHRLGVAQRDRDVPSIDAQMQPAGEDLGQRRAVPPGHGRVEQGVGVGDLQLEGRVEVVHGQRCRSARPAPVAGRDS